MATTSRIRPGCMLKRFDERHTFLRARTDAFGRGVYATRRHIDGAEVEDWANAFVHANACPCRVTKAAA